MNKNLSLRTALITIGALIIALILVAFITARVRERQPKQVAIPPIDDSKVQTSEQIRRQLEELEELRNTLNPNSEPITEKTISAQIQELEALRKIQNASSPIPPTQNDIQTQLEELEKLRGEQLSQF